MRRLLNLAYYSVGLGLGLGLGVGVRPICVAGVFMAQVAVGQQDRADSGADFPSTEPVVEIVGQKLADEVGKAPDFQQDFPHADDPRVRAALAKMRAGSLNSGIKHLLDLTAEGVAEASFHLGEIYNLGVGRPRNPRIALMYYRLAGRQGIQRADLTRANLLYFDIKDDDALAEAVAVYKRYALADVPEALYMLGSLYWNGSVTGESDPVRGYGLMRRAKDKLYPQAVQAERDMARQLSFDARDAGRAFADALTPQSLQGDEVPLAIDLVLEGVAPAGAGSAGLPASWGATDWQQVWRVEVGFANSDIAARQLSINIHEKLAGRIPNVQHQVVEDSFRPGRFRVVFGPLQNLQEAIDKCFLFKRAGFACFSRAPNTIHSDPMNDRDNSITDSR